MRKFLLVLLLVVLLIVGGVIAAPFLLPRSFVKSQVENIASASLGRELRIDGPLDYRLWPPLSLHAEDVRLADAGDEATSEPMVAFASLDVELDALAYRKGLIKLDRLELQSPRIHLRIDENGRPNWQLDEPKADDANDAGDTEVGEVEIPRFAIDDVSIDGGTLVFEDGRTGTVRRFEQIGLTLRTDPASGALLLVGTMHQAGEAAELDGRIADANALAAGGRSDLSLSLTLPGATLALDGGLSTADDAFEVQIDLEVPQPRALATWTGATLPMIENVLRSASLQAAVHGDGERIEVAPLDASVDDLVMKGDLAVALGGRPKLTGSLDLGSLALDPVLPPAEDAARAGDATAPAGTTAGPASGWPDEEIVLPLPLPLDFDLVVAFDRLTARGIELGAGKIDLFADNLTSRVQLLELALYDGRATGTAEVTAGTPLQVAADLDLADVRLLPLLQATADLDRLEGTGSLALEATTQGATVAQMMAALDGRGNLLLQDGAVLGINIGALVRSVATLGVSRDAKEQRRTDFAEAGGTFTIDQGLLRNDDFALRAPVLRVTGEGEVDLAARTLNYTLLPRVAATLQGQAAAAEPEFQAGVPIRLQGPWSDVAVQLDIGGVLSGNVGDPAALARTIEQLSRDPEALRSLSDKLGIGEGGAIGEQLKGVLGGLLGNRPGTGDTPVEPSAGETSGTEQSPSELREPNAGKLLDAIGDLIKR
ncbi:MAG: AsmA family protein [Geminicoccaceae bacterium]|nr:AsmA family protein [Geminicoccaceae bacterium]